MMEQNQFVAYDYKEITVDSDEEALYRDAYENFGWEADSSPQSHGAAGKVVLHFRRNRKIYNKPELTRLQRNFDACMEEIRQLESSKTTKAMGAAVGVGVLGTAFMAGSVFAITAPTPMIPLCIVLAVPGFLCWALPWFLYKTIVRKRTEKLNPLLEAKYDELYAVCEKGNKLLQSS